jgi:hypothetical protein
LESSQNPPQSEPSLAQVGRAPCGAPATGEQVPGLAGSSQASHWPAQAALQQTPSTQRPETHSLVCVQVVPLLRLNSQLPLPLQKALGAHCVSLAQVWRQALLVQMPGAQLVVTSAGQLFEPPVQLAGLTLTVAL